MRRLTAKGRLLGIAMFGVRNGSGISQFPLWFLCVPAFIMCIKRRSSCDMLSMLSSGVVLKMLAPISFFSMYFSFTLKWFGQGTTSCLIVEEQLMVWPTREGQGVYRDIPLLCGTRRCEWVRLLDPSTFDRISSILDRVVAPTGLLSDHSCSL